MKNVYFITGLVTGTVLFFLLYWIELFLGNPVRVTLDKQKSVVFNGHYYQKEYKKGWG